MPLIYFVAGVLAATFLHGLRSAPRAVPAPDPDPPVPAPRNRLSLYQSPPGNN